MAADKNSSSDEVTFGYLDIPNMAEHDWGKQEGLQQKMLRKTKENPFIPIGLGITTFALAFGLWQLRTGNRVLSQKMMRLRVAAQGFTVLALLGGITLGGAMGSGKREN